MVAYAFNAQQHEPKYSAAGGLPVGKYKGVISDTRQEMTQKGDGGYLALDLKVIEGPLTGQFQTDRLNLHNTNPLTVEIANKQLSAYCHVTGKFVIGDTAELHNIPFMFEIRQQKKNPEYTEVAAIWDINGNEPGKSGATAQPAQQAAPPPQTQTAPATPPQGGWGGPGAGPANPGANPGGWGGGAPAAPATPPQTQAAPPQGGWGQPAGGAPAQPAWGR